MMYSMDPITQSLPVVYEYNRQNIVQREVPIYIYLTTYILYIKYILVYILLYGGELYDSKLQEP